MSRLLIVPAAGLGSRLGAATPKLLVPVNGRPMIDHLLDLYRPIVSRAAVVVQPSALSAVRDHLAGLSLSIDLVVQPEPTGMLDAIQLGAPVVERWQPQRVWITWCDQIAILPQTIERVAAAEALLPEPDLILATCRSADPYVHLDRDEAGRIVRVLHRREGDAMPAHGESDAGLFDVSLRAYRDELPRYAASPEIGARTGERNFVPFVARLSRTASVVTVPCALPEEAVGINNPDELARIEAHLRARAFDS